MSLPELTYDLRSQPGGCSGGGDRAGLEQAIASHDQIYRQPMHHSHQQVYSSVGTILQLRFLHSSKCA